MPPAGAKTRRYGKSGTREIPHRDPRRVLCLHDVKIDARCTRCQARCGRLARAVVDPFVALKRASCDGVQAMLQDFAPELPTSRRACWRCSARWVAARSRAEVIGAS